ncbi:hypothetical protein COLO4_00389 [Corchorus olitorius]|uniref:F-box domain-containing protein n=1 Tax=Corchorus olitorius TaxID=93759 RepID=A0A1R3L402_9ROSI|nr:hypothetical protein COLO4_00389 [Corchorus olitorius]
MDGVDGGAADADRISQLPEEIMAHIVSFLNMKEAVATRVLNKTWEKFWTNQVGQLRNLEFDMDNFRGRNRVRFRNYVDQIISLRGPDNVEEFRLGFYELEQDDLPSISRWIDYATSCQVQRMELYLYGTLPFGGEEEEEGHLFLISAPNLIRLKISLVTPDEFQFCSDHTFIIQTPNLEYLEIAEDTIFASYEIQEIPTLDEAKLNIGPHSDFITEGEISQEEARRVMVLLQGVKHARKLTLTEATTAALGLVVDDDDEPLPFFPNLLNLQLCIDNCYGWKLLPDFLTNSPNLQVLQLNKLQEPYDYEKEPEFILDEETYGWIEPEYVPTCLAERLREIRMISLKRSEDEEDVIRFLLKNSMVLQRMTINFSEYYDGEALDEDMIEEFPRGSNICQLIFD